MSTKHDFRNWMVGKCIARAHQDCNLWFEQLNDHGQMDVLADNVEADDLLESTTEGQFISRELFFNGIQLKVGTRRVSSS